MQFSCCVSLDHSVVVMSKWIMVIFVAVMTSNAILYAETNVLAFSGSVRDESTNTKLVQEASRIARDMGARVKVINLKDYPMPFYNEDLEREEGMPKNAQELRQLMIQSQVIFIASPEYNASVTAILKNALDWASRSEQGGSSRDAFKGKIFALMSTSPGKGGGARGLGHLRTIVEAVGGTVPLAGVSVPNAYMAFAEDGSLKDAKLETQLKELVQETLKESGMHLTRATR